MAETACTAAPPDGATLIEIVPDPQTVRERLGQTLREAEVLRQLLRVAERAEKARRQQREVQRVRR